MIGKLLGYTHLQTTARYAHLARNSVKTAAVRRLAITRVDIRTIHTVGSRRR